MNDQDLDRILARETGIAPSEKFAANVMAAIHRDLEMPPPIPFPWKRALAGMASLIVTMVLLLALALRNAGEIVAAVYAVPWVLAGVAVTALSLAIPIRLFWRSDQT